MIKKLKKQKGYTLVELLAVIIIITIVGTIITSIISIALRGSNRSTNVNSVRQSGDFTISQMSKMISYAKKFEGVASSEDVDEDGVHYATQCVDSQVEYNFLKIQSFDGGETTFVCDSDTNTVASYSGNLTSWPISNGDNTPNVKLIDPNKFTVSACYFTCKQDNISVSPQIDINFTVANTAAETSTLTENKVEIPFEATVGFRNTGN